MQGITFSVVSVLMLAPMGMSKAGRRSISSCGSGLAGRVSNVFAELDDRDVQEFLLQLATAPSAVLQEPLGVQV